MFLALGEQKWLSANSDILARVRLRIRFKIPPVASFNQKGLDRAFHDGFC